MFVLSQLFIITIADFFLALYIENGVRSTFQRDIAKTYNIVVLPFFIHVANSNILTVIFPLYEKGGSFYS